MTLAICFNCGSDKNCLLDMCRSCNKAPQNAYELATSLLLSAHVNSQEKLTEYRVALRNGRLTIQSEQIKEAKEALQDRQLMRWIKRESESCKEDKETSFRDTQTPSSTLDVTSTNSKVRANPPAKTVLHNNAFGVIGATMRDNRRRIVELAEEQSLVTNEEVCTKAHADLTNPRNRLYAEMAWLPGLSPRRANEMLGALHTDIDSIKDNNSLPYLSNANLLASAFEVLDPEMDAELWAEWVIDLAYTVELIEADDVLHDINEDRTIAGFPEVRSIDDIEVELSERRRYYRDVIKAVLNEFPTMKLVDVVTRVAEETTSVGEAHAPLLVDELIDSYETDTQGYLRKEADNILALIEKAGESAASGEKAVSPLIDRIDQMVRNWDKVAQPTQLSMKARGMEHELSSELAYQIRSLGIDLVNNHGMLEIADRMTKTLQEVFAELPEVVDRLDEDLDALEGMFKQRKDAEQEVEEWAREITYEADVGAVFKSKLRVSPDGVQWKSNVFPLDSITRVRWGGVSRTVNGIPAGTTYTIAFGDDKKESVVELRRSEVYQAFLGKLWQAVCARLMAEMAEQLKMGKQLQFGDALVDDEGAELTKHKLLGNKKIYCKWADTTISPGQGCFYIKSKEDKKTYSSMSYIDVPNAHIFEALIRISFKNWQGRISGILEG